MHFPLEQYWEETVEIWVVRCHLTFSVELLLCYSPQATREQRLCKQARRPAEHLLAQRPKVACHAEGFVQDGAEVLGC